jgi:hypothetical protein
LDLGFQLIEAFAFLLFEIGQARLLGLQLTDIVFEVLDLLLSVAHGALSRNQLLSQDCLLVLGLTELHPQLCIVREFLLQVMDL